MYHNMKYPMVRASLDRLVAVGVDECCQGLISFCCTWIHWLLVSMAQRADPGEYGGYDCDFVDPVPDELSCDVCVLPFRDPHLLQCCGKKICYSCIERIRSDGKPCPYCNQSIESVLDKQLRGKVHDLDVYCSKRVDGCKWKGQLRDLERHIKEKCLFRPQPCQYGCGQLFPRSGLTVHETDHCPRRPLEVKFEHFQREVMAQFAKYEYKLAQMKAQLFCPPCKLTMSSYFKHKNKRDEWFSPPFYSRPGGYKLCLKVNTNGDRDGAGSHISVYVYLMRGENDDGLVWPFQATIEIQLVNKKKHYKCRSLKFDEKAAARGLADRVTDEDTRDLGWGFSQFVSHRRVERINDHSQYLVDDSLEFIIAGVGLLHNN